MIFQKARAGRSLLDRDSGRRVADCLDAVAVGIANEGGVVVGMVLRAKARHAVIRPACGKRRAVEGVDGGPVAGAKAEMHPRGGRHLCLGGDREFDADGSRRNAIVAAAPGEIDDADQPERLKRRIVESAAFSEIADTEGNVVEPFEILRSCDR